MHQGTYCIILWTVGHVEHDIFTGIQLKKIIIKPLAMHDIY